MNEELAIAREHYQAAITDSDALLSRVSAALSRTDAAMSPESLARFDQFHIGGLAATARMAEGLALSADAHLLDAGSGLGGPSRFLAQRFSCQVTGVDIAPVYVAIARLLAEKADVAGRVSYLVGSITELPFAPATFDAVCTQHVVMNVRDRVAAYREIRRVLRPGGRFAFYDPYVPEGALPPHYPTPWAESAANSTLLTEQETRVCLAQAGLRLRSWDDVSEVANGWIAQQQRQIAQPTDTRPDQSPNLAWVLGPRMQPMVANYARNIQEGRIRLVMGFGEAS